MMKRSKSDVILGRSFYCVGFGLAVEIAGQRTRSCVFDTAVLVLDVHDQVLGY